MSIIQMRGRERENMCVLNYIFASAHKHCEYTNSSAYTLLVKCEDDIEDDIDYGCFTILSRVYITLICTLSLWSVERRAFLDPPISFPQIWVKRLPDNSKLRIYVTQLVRGKYVLKRRSA